MKSFFGELAAAAFLVLAPLAFLIRRSRARKRAGSAPDQRQLRAIVDNLPVVVGYADREERLRFVNRAFAASSHLKGELAGATLREALGADAYEFARPAIERALRGERVTFQGVIEVDGARRHREVTYVPDVGDDGAVAGFFGIGYDVTERVRQADELRAREAHLNSVLDTMAEGLVIHARDGAIVRANAAASRILGLTQDQLLGRTSTDPDWQAVAEDESPLPGERHPAMISLRTGAPLRGFLMGVRRGAGPLRWLSVNSQPLFDDGAGTPSGVLVTFAEITQQRALTAELERARADLGAVLDHVPVGICSWQADGTNRIANRVAESGFRITEPGGATGKHLSELLGPEGWARQRPYFEAALAGRTQRNEVQRTLEDGTRHYLQVEWVPDPRFGAEGVTYSVVTDVTELHMSLERIRELARQIDRAGERERHSLALALNEGIAQDLYGMRLMLQQVGDPASDPQRLRELLGDLRTALDQCMADVRAVANDLRPSELAHLTVSEAIRGHAVRFAGLSGLDIRVHMPERAPQIDEGLQLFLYRAAQEALVNVVRHARARRVDVTLEAGPAKIELRVVDDGIGIEPQDLSKPGSFGLLAIRERCREVGGSLRVRKGAAGGTEFSLRVPARANQEPTAESRAP